MRRAAVFVLAVLTTWTAPGHARATAPPPVSPCEFTGVDRIVAVGDAHGDYDHFLQVLQAAGVVDAKKKWSGGTTHLVQTGDVLDRGNDSRKILDLLRAITPQAAAAGGAVHELVGNHEEMRMVGDFRYTSKAEYGAFATSESASLRQQVADSVEPESRNAILDSPLGKIEMVRAFAPNGEYGAYLRQLPAVIRINDIVFLHGGLSPAYGSRSCAEINEEVRRDLTEDLAKTRAAVTSTLVGSADGPLWYRGLAQEPDTFAPEVEAIVAAQKARALVIGHTGAPGYRITMRFGGKVVLIDTGMNLKYEPDGHPSALEITRGAWTAIYLDGRVPLGAGPGGGTATHQDELGNHGIRGQR